MTAEPSPDLAPSPRQFAAFEVHGLLVGIEVARVQEVLGSQPLVPVPRAPVGIVGLLNLRGQILAATDARVRLALPARVDREACVHVIIRTGRSLDSLIMDAVVDVMDLDPATGGPTPDTVGPAVARFVTAAFPIDGRQLLIMDIDAILNEDEEGRTP